MSEEMDYFIRQKGRDLTRIENRIGTGLRLPQVRYRTDSDVTEIFTRISKRTIMKTEEDARAFAMEAAKNMKEHIDWFSKRTEGTGIPGLGSGAVTGERLRKGGLRAGVGWEVEPVEYGGFSGIAGIGVGRGKIPLNVSGEPYAWFVDKGTNRSEGKYIPKKVDFEMWDVSNPTRRIKYHDVYENWTPKFTPGANELQQQWWESSKKRAMLKKDTIKQFGRYWREPSNLVWSVPFEGKRKSYEPAYPSYKVTGMGKGLEAFSAGGVRKPWLGQDVWYRGKPRLVRKDWVAERSDLPASGDHRAHKIYQDRMLSWLNTLTEAQLIAARDESEGWWMHSVQFNPKTVLGGKLRGYGGHIMMGTGDVAYSMFSLDVRFKSDAIAGHQQAFLEGYSGSIDTDVSKPRGLGKRLNNESGNVRDLGWHEGTVARNFLYNTAVHMERWMKGYYKRKKKLRESKDET